MRKFIFTRSLFLRVPNNKKIPKIEESFKREKLNILDTNSIIAVQCSESILFCKILSLIAVDLSNVSGSKLKLIVTRSINGSVGNNFSANLTRFFIVGWLISNQWARVYKSVISGIGYKSQSLIDFPFSVLRFIKAYFIWKNLKSNDALLNLRINDVYVGDLIIDTYLRFRPSPRFIHSDFFVCRILWQTINDLYKAEIFFSSEHVKYYISTYSTYIQNGVPVRVAIKCGVNVYLFSGALIFGKKLKQSDDLSTPDTSDYKYIFDSFFDKDRKINEAEVLLLDRLNGASDDVNFYMKKFTSHGLAGIEDDLKHAVVIFLHDFFDSPHVHHNFIFIDFWEWITFTIHNLIENKIKFVIKPHPNQVDLSVGVLEELKKQYPNIKVISDKISIKYLVEQNISCGVTAYGSVAHELAYFGVPVVTCAKDPHHSFNFCLRASTKNEYIEFLKRPIIELSVLDMRIEALSFFYMHNIWDSEKVALRKYFNKCLLASEIDDDGEKLEDICRLMRNSKEYKNMIKKISNYK